MPLFQRVTTTEFPDTLSQSRYASSPDGKDNASTIACSQGECIENEDPSSLRRILDVRFPHRAKLAAAKKRQGV